MNFRKITACLVMATGLLFPALTNNSNIHAHSDNYAISISNTIKAKQNTETFSIKDSNLASAMMTLLNKQQNSFTKSDLINNDNYKVIKTQIGTNPDPLGGEDIPIFEYSATKTCLDLANKNITDISELSQFIWPRTLTSIDLSNNNIDNSHLENLQLFSSLTPTSDEDIENLEEDEMVIYSDIANFVDIINLNSNKISLSTADSSILTNNKFLFGLQNISDEIHNKVHPTEYYIKTDHLDYFNITTTKNTVNIDITLDNVTKLSDHGYGDYVINFSSKEDVNIIPFEKEIKTSLFNIHTTDTFWVERKGDFHITKEDIIVEGLTEGFTIPANIRGTCKTAGINSTLIEFTTNTKTWTTLVEYIVRDTQIPTIKLIGPSEIYLKVNGQHYTEYRAEGKDSGDDISELVQISGSVDITTPGTYIITYTLTDYSGKEAIPVTRKVVVQEYALGSVKLSTIEEEYIAGQDITISVSLPNGTDLSKYTNLLYKWYYNGVEFQSTTGDIRTGKSSITINEPNKKDVEIYAMLIATLEDGTKETYMSNIIDIDIESGNKSIPTIITALLVALIIIISLFITATIYKKKKATHSKGSKKSSKGKSKKKEKDNKKSAHSNYDSIQVIKDYSGNNNDNNPPSKIEH